MPRHPQTLLRGAALGAGFRHALLMALQGLFGFPARRHRRGEGCLKAGYLGPGQCQRLIQRGPFSLQTRQRLGGIPLEPFGGLDIALCLGAALGQFRKARAGMGEVCVQRGAFAG